MLPTPSITRTEHAFNYGHLQLRCQAAMEVLMQVLWGLRDVAMGVASDGATR